MANAQRYQCEQMACRTRKSWQRRRKTLKKNAPRRASKGINAADCKNASVQRRHMCAHEAARPIYRHHRISARRLLRQRLRQARFSVPLDRHAYLCQNASRTAQAKHHGERRVAWASSAEAGGRQQTKELAHKRKSDAAARGTLALRVRHSASHRTQSRRQHAATQGRDTLLAAPHIARCRSGGGLLPGLFAYLAAAMRL